MFRCIILVLSYPNLASMFNASIFLFPPLKGHLINYWARAGRALHFKISAQGSLESSKQIKLSTKVSAKGSLLSPSRKIIHFNKYQIWRPLYTTCVRNAVSRISRNNNGAVITKLKIDARIKIPKNNFENLCLLLTLKSL